MSKRNELDFEEILMGILQDADARMSDSWAEDIVETLREWKKAYDKGDCL